MCRLGSTDSVAAPLVSLHVAANAEGFATAGVGALEGLFASVRVAMDSKTAWPAESLVASRADVAILALGEQGHLRRVKVVVVMLPAVALGVTVGRWRS